MFHSKRKFRLLVLHGPNLNLLGEREPEVYGRMSLRELNASIIVHCRANGIRVKCFQSNHEGRIVDLLHAHRRWADGVVINPGALTHTSYVVRDAVAGIRLPTVEVHLSDIHRREEFRKVSVVEPVCAKQISGKGMNSYLEGIDFLLEQWRSRTLEKTG
jgi:3-dehydroquinate dehydratase-2